MIRTQIFLTNDQSHQLRELKKVTGKNQSELIRQAIDTYLDRQTTTDRQAILESARGLWRDRQDLPDLFALRAEFERGGQ
ncbi:CopG family transcriptional regulator [Thiocystis minor]|uniref:ribbon-helix-helix protein, CopG family n=1 Tax=Thiocystis minor TaxID=61597 RepID=UPI0019138235|nr:ribbon-helix-helix protein, CopG family [Thiocystis minor]MBK5966949.1 CopG family transcriptional regulator [Thiocystis minor]